MSTRRVKMLFMLVLAAGVMGMGRKEAKDQNAPAAPASGVTGRVEIWSGNHMPMVDKGATDGKNVLPGASLRVRLYEPVRGLTGASADTIPVPLVAETTTDADGRFTIPCREGKYSLFVEDSTGWYANGWDGDGVQGAVVVEPMKMTEVILKNTRKATF